MNQTGTAAAASTESDEVSVLSPLSWREMVLAVLPMGIMALYGLAIYVVNILVPFSPPASPLEAALRGFFLGSTGSDPSEPILYWSPALGVIGVGVPAMIAGIRLINREQIPVWLLPALGIAISIVLMALQYALPSSLAIVAWLALSAASAVALLLLHRQRPLPLAVWGCLAFIYYLGWRAVAFGAVPIDPPTLDPQFGKTTVQVTFSSIGMPPILSILVATSAWLGRSHRQHALLPIFAAAMLLTNYITYFNPVFFVDHATRTIGIGHLVWAGLYLAWGAAILAMLRTRTSIQSARIALLAVALLAIGLTTPPPGQSYTTSEVELVRLFQLAAALLASASAISAAGEPGGSDEALQANPVYRWVISQHGVTLSRFARIRSGLALAAILLCLLSSASLLDRMLPGNTFMSSFVWNVVILGTVFVAQILIPTFLAIESARRLIPMVNSDMFVLVRITQQGAEQIISGLDAGIRRKLRAALVGYGLILLVYYSNDFDLLALFHSYGQRTLEYSIALRVGLFGMALLAIRLGELFALVSRNATEARLAAGLLTFVLTLVLIGAPLPTISSGLFYVAALLLIAFVPIVIADRLTQVNTWLIARRAREIT